MGNYTLLSPSVGECLIQQPEIIELVFDFYQGVFCVSNFRPSSDNELPTPKEECDDIRVINSIDKPREPFRFVFDAFEPEADSDSVQIKRMIEIPA